MGICGKAGCVLPQGHKPYQRGGEPHKVEVEELERCISRSYAKIGEQKRRIEMLEEMSNKADIDGRIAALISMIKTLPRISGVQRGVYFVFNGNEVEYIGSSVNVQQRFKSHPACNLLDVRVFPMHEDIDHIEFERAMIRLFRPRLNKMYNVIETT